MQYHCFGRWVVYFAVLAIAPTVFSQELAQSLAAMERAVLAGDPDAYLEHVARDDKVFFTEQTNWAADLVEHTPIEFDLDVTEIESSHETEVTGDLRMTWRMHDGSERSVDFPARFTLAPDSDQTWLYAGRAWDRREGEGIVILCEPSLTETAEMVAEIFPPIRAHVEAVFELKVPPPQVVKLYRGMSDLQASIYLSYTDPLGGWNEPGESIKLMARPSTSRRFIEPMLAHEFGHVVTFAMGPESTYAPWWLLEGVAEHSASKFMRPRQIERMRASVRGWAESDSLAEWSDISDFRETPFGLYGWVYPQGHHFATYVTERFGRSARNNWVRLIAQGKSLEEATQITFGMNFDSLDRDWQASILRHGRARPQSGRPTRSRGRAPMTLAFA